MAEADEHFKRVVAGFLRSRGLKVDEIPRSSTLSPDLIVEEGGPDAALIEIKQKAHGVKELEAFLTAASVGGVASRSRPTGRRDTLDAIVRKGVRQTLSKDPDRSMFHLVWIHCEGYDAALNEMQVHATLYGTQKMFSMDHPNVLTCYYFWNSSFYRHRADLDGVIVSRGEEAQLALNDHSPRFEALKNSAIAAAFADAVSFPQKYGLADGIMYYDTDAPRGTVDEQEAYLRKKYGLAQLQIMNMGLHEATSAVPKDSA